MDFVRIVNGSPERFNPTPRALYKLVKKQCWPAQPPAELLASFDIYPLGDGTKPTPDVDERVVPGPIEETSPGLWERTWVIEQRTRVTVTNLQFRKALRSLNRMNAFKTWFNAQSEEDQEEWQFAPEIASDGAMIAKLKADLSLTNPQLRALFREALSQ